MNIQVQMNKMTNPKSLNNGQIRINKMSSKKRRITTPGIVASDALSATDKDAKIRALYKEHYIAAKAKYGPRVAVLLEVGTFYELYDTEHSVTGLNDTNVREITETLGALPTIRAAIEPNYHYLFWGLSLIHI